MDIAQPVKIGKFKASKMIARESWNLLKQDKEMMFFPVFSAAVMLIIALIGGAIFFFNVLGGDIAALETYAAKDSGNLEIIFLFLWLVRETLMHSCLKILLLKIMITF